MKDINVISLVPDKVLIIVNQMGEIVTYQNNTDSTYYLLEVPADIKPEEIPIEDVKLKAKEALNQSELLIQKHIEYLFNRYRLYELRVSRNFFARKVSEFYKRRIFPENVKNLMENIWGLKYQSSKRVKYPIGTDESGNVVFESEVQRCYVIKNTSLEIKEEG
jgi:hypothetical protein